MVLQRSHPAPPPMVRHCGCNKEHCKACKQRQHWQSRNWQWGRRPVVWYTETDGEEYLREMTDSEINNHIRFLNQLMTC